MGQQGTVHIHPETASAHLQADFDGDRLVFEQASKYPTLAAEIKEYNLPENRYPDVVKRDKIKRLSLKKCKESRIRRVPKWENRATTETDTKLVPK